MRKLRKGKFPAFLRQILPRKKKKGRFFLGDCKSAKKKRPASGCPEPLSCCFRQTAVVFGRIAPPSGIGSPLFRGAFATPWALLPPAFYPLRERIFRLRQTPPGALSQKRNDYSTSHFCCQSEKETFFASPPTFFCGDLRSPARACGNFRHPARAI